MKILLISLIVCLTLAAPARAGDGPLLHAALIALSAAHGADLATTEYCLGRGTCRESNPVLRPFERQPLALGSIKMAVAAANVAILVKAHRSHPKIVLWIAAGEAAVFTAVALHNARLGR